MGLPSFSVADYRQLLVELRTGGFSLLNVGVIAQSAERAVYLRHDVDFDPRSAAPMAAAESDLGVRSTYYLLLTQHYNPLQRDNRRAIRNLTQLGHEIGLHYDMESYPSDPAAARLWLEREAAILADIAESPITTISMHQPSFGAPDPFRDLPEFVHPHNSTFEADIAYISDSCRAWRDSTLVSCTEGNGPSRILLNTHPELWLDGAIRDRMAYLDFLRDRVGGRYGEYLDTEVRRSWLSHEGGRLHDHREALSR